MLASTATSEVFKVKYQNDFGALKILSKKGMNFEIKGAIVLKCFNGNGAVKLVASDEGAHLLEYIDGPQLKEIVLSGSDDRATHRRIGRP